MRQDTTGTVGLEFEGLVPVKCHRLPFVLMKLVLDDQILDICEASGQDEGE